MGAGFSMIYRLIQQAYFDAEAQAMVKKDCRRYHSSGHLAIFEQRLEAHALEYRYDKERSVQRR